MSTTFTWKRNIFTGKYTISTGTVKVGYLKRVGWSRSKVGEIYDKKFRFNREGIFKSKTEVLDDSDQSKIGEITFNLMRSKASFEYLGEIFEWKFSNFMKTKWAFHRGSEIRLTSAAKTMKGSIEAVVQDDCLLLAGLYISSIFHENSGTTG